MRSSDLSMLVFAGYAAGLAGGFLLFPNPVITLFGFAPTAEVWIRILGYLLGAIAFYYFMAVRERALHFYRWTVYARLPILPTFAVLVLTGIGPPVLLLFGSFDLACALWTWRAVRKEGNPPAPGHHADAH